MRLLRGVYPEELDPSTLLGVDAEQRRSIEGLAMTSEGGLTYAKNFWDATLACKGDDR
jgi:hypothetical protein